MEDVVPDRVDGPEDEFAQAEIVDLREAADDAPIIKLANQIIAQAVEQGASDIHLEPETDSMRVRLRIDGVLTEAHASRGRMVAGVVSRIKIMAELDIAERRVPQDGRVGLTIDGHHVDLRVVTLPSVHGESVVMRILDKESVVMDLDRLGMGEHDRERFERAIHQPYGAVLVTGPTGSGKSTSLYAALGVLNTPEKNIVTIEDPVEYQLEGVTQVQVNPRAGLGFATGLRAMMRADPDIIMVGEIRDRETAQIAVEAALTGHLVLSTLHTNDAATAITRLVEMGVEPFLVASSIGCVVAQRLARTLCQHCKQRAIIPVATLRANGFPSWLDVEALRAGRLRSLQRHRLQGPSRSLRGHGHDRGDPRPGASSARRRTRSSRSRSATACAGCARTACTRSCWAAPRSPRSRGSPGRRSRPSRHMRRRRGGDPRSPETGHQPLGPCRVRAVAVAEDGGQLGLLVVDPPRSSAGRGSTTQMASASQLPRATPNPATISSNPL